MITVVSGAVSADQPCVLVNNLMAAGTLASGGTAAGALANVLGPQTFDYWQGTAAPNRLAVTLAVAAPADCLCIAAHDIGSKGASIRFQYSLDGTTFLSHGAAITPSDDSDIMIIAPPVTAIKWAVQVSAAPGIMPNLGIVTIGQRLVFPSPLMVPYTPLNFGAKIDLEASQSLGGQLMATRFTRKGKGVSVPFCPLDGPWVKANLPAFAAAYDSGQPFFFAGCPEQYPDDIGYCWRAAGASELRPAFFEGGLWANVKMELVAYGA